jgi:phosphomannomutase
MLIKSISGIRGTIGGAVGDGLNPIDTARFTAAYASHIRANKKTDSNKIIVGRDARISGEMVSRLVVGTLLGMGFDVVNIGLATTPTTEFAVTAEQAAGGIILTASHNPKQWNALKLLNEHGEFLNAENGENILNIVENESYIFADVNNLGKLTDDFTYTKKHIDKILTLDLVDAEAIRTANFTIAIDAVNSVGGFAIPELLDALGVKNVKKLHCEPNGHFAHDPEPLPENLTEISNLMKKGGIDAGFAVDPDVDRLAIICEDGTMFGEEYTLVSIADYVLQHTPGNTVSNMSSTRALRDITEKYGFKHSASAVGEVNVTTMMKASNAVIGGEGNGGVIYPANHYGRDALAGIALFLTYLAKSKLKVSELRKTYPNYFVTKKKIELTPAINIDVIFDSIKKSYRQYEINDADGVKIDFPQGWVHLRKSNTEPVIRIYSEAETEKQAEKFALAIMEEVKRIAGI